MNKVLGTLSSFFLSPGKVITSFIPGKVHLLWPQVFCLLKLVSQLCEIFSPRKKLGWQLVTGTRHIPESWTRNFELDLMPGTLVEGAVNEDKECVCEREGEQVSWDSYWNFMIGVHMHVGTYLSKSTWEFTVRITLKLVHQLMDKTGITCNIGNVPCG